MISKLEFTLTIWIFIRILNFSSAYVIKYNLIGCYRDFHLHDLIGPDFHSESMKLDKCAKFCSNKNYQYFGVQNGKYCRCGNEYGLYGSSEKCHKKCSGNSRQICGGKRENSIFKLEYTNETTVPPTKRTTKSTLVQNITNTYKNNSNIESTRPLLNWIYCPKEIVMDDTEKLKLEYSGQNFTIIIEDIDKKLNYFNVTGNDSIEFSQNFTSVGEFNIEAFDSNLFTLSICKINVTEKNDTESEIDNFQLNSTDTQIVYGLLRRNEEISDCLKNCSNNGICKSASNDSIKCFCNQYFTGPDCSFDMRPCSTKKCMNGGQCVEKNSTSFECNCTKNYFGNRCEFLRQDLCANKTCSLHGYCIYDEKDESVKCNCFKFYTGENCEKETNEIKVIKKTIKTTTIIAIVVIVLTFLFFLFLDNFGQTEKKEKKIMMKFIYVN